MGRIMFYALVIMLLGSNIYGQPDTLWTRTCGGANTDAGLSVVQTIDGGYVIAGWTESFGAGLADVWFIKTDASGDTQWTKTYGGIDNDMGFSIIQSSDGGYIIAGLTASFGAGNYDVYLIKTNALGDTQWTRTYGGANTDEGFCIANTSDSGFAIVGTTHSFGSGASDAWLLKLMPESGVEENGPDKVKLELFTNKPNPFRGNTEIRYILSANSWVRIAIYNLYGEKIARIVDENKSAGLHITFWDGKDDAGREVASGIYFCRLEIPGINAVRKFCFLKESR